MAVCSTASDPSSLFAKRKPWRGTSEDLSVSCSSVTQKATRHLNQGAQHILHPEIVLLAIFLEEQRLDIYCNSYLSSKFSILALLSASLCDWHDDEALAESAV